MAEVCTCVGVALPISGCGLKDGFLANVVRLWAPVGGPAERRRCRRARLDSQRATRVPLGAVSLE